MNMKIPALRTPESCFADTIEDFPYPPSYLNIATGNLRMAYYDIPAEFPKKQSTVFLCLHGEPTWSYLYRHMIPELRAAGRVVCIDLLGFGRSDKPTKPSDHSFSLHRDALLFVIHQLNLTNITLLVQDWGGILGLTLPLDEPHRYSRLIVMNTMLPIEPETSQLALDLKTKARSGFARWHNFSQSSDDWNVGELIHLTCRKRLTPEVIAAYNAPFPTKDYKAGVNVFPKLVPLSPAQDGYAMGRQALQFWQDHWTGHAFVAIGAKDRVVPPRLMKRLAASIRGCCSNEPLVLSDTGHFVQEESGREVARAALDYFELQESKRKVSKL